MGKTAVVLHGAPDMDIVSPRPQHRPVQAMALHFSESAMKDLIAAARTGDRAVELAFDKAGTTLRFGSNLGTATLKPAPCRHELYRSTEDAAQDLHFAGLLDHDLTLDGVRAGAISSEDAFRAIKAKMEELEEAKKSRTPLFDPTLRPDPSKVKPGARATTASKSMQKGSAMLQRDRAALARQHAAMGLQPAGNHRPPPPPARPLAPPAASPPSRPPSAQSQHPPPVALPQDERSRRQRAVRTPLLHLLAMGPCAERTLVGKLKVPREDLDIWLQKFGRRDDATGTWRLSDRGYKEVKVWEFTYAPADREQVIQLAISAYDRLRLSRSDALWQQLLPLPERDKGVCLSRLNLHGGPRAPTVPSGGPSRPPSASPAAAPPPLSSNGSRSGGSRAASAEEDAVRPRATKRKEQLAYEKRLLSTKKNKPRPAPKASAEGDKKKTKPPATATAAAKKKGAAGKAVATPLSQEFVHSSDEETVTDPPPSTVTPARKRKAAEVEGAEEKSMPKRRKEEVHERTDEKPKPTPGSDEGKQEKKTTTKKGEAKPTPKQPKGIAKAKVAQPSKPTEAEATQRPDAKRPKTAPTEKAKPETRPREVTKEKNVTEEHPPQRDLPEKGTRDVCQPKEAQKKQKQKQQQQQARQLPTKEKVEKQEDVKRKEQKEQGQLKRKRLDDDDDKDEKRAEEQDQHEPAVKRRRSSSSTAEASGARPTLEPLGSGPLHDHDSPPTSVSANSSHTTPARGSVNGPGTQPAPHWTNGHHSEAGLVPTNGHHREAGLVPTNGHDGTPAAALGTNGRSHTPDGGAEVMELAREFKAVHATYAKLYKEVEEAVVGTEAASAEKREELLKMHWWLVERKAEICRREHEVTDE